MGTPNRRRRIVAVAHWADDVDSELFGQVRAEFGSYLQKPFEVPTVVAVNVALALGAWFFISPSFVIKYTSLAFLPIALVAWAFADVPATNLYGAHPTQALANIDNPWGIRRMMTVKDLALWLLISPACMLLSLALIPGVHQPLLSVAISVACLSMPFAYLGLAATMAPLLPFHPMPWRDRIRRPDTWLRYGLALAIAYFALTGPAAAIVTAPAAFVLTRIGNEPIHVLIAAVLITPWSLFLWRLGLRAATAIAARRRPWLVEFLSDPARG